MLVSQILYTLTSLKFMRSIEKLLQEHREIEQYLDDLEIAMNEDEELNISNISHIFKRLHNLWNYHEENEENFFRELSESGVKLPFSRFLFEHQELKGHKKVLHDAINSGSDIKIRVALDTDGRMLINKLRKHIEDEEESILNNYLNVNYTKP